jgi:DNA-binding PadR family transcriptional regulator
MKRNYLGEFEEIVLLTVAALEDGEAYGVAITHAIAEQTGRTARLNQVHAALLRLEEKGMVSTRLGGATAERGGRRKRLVTVTAYGHRVLREIKEVRARLWSLVPGTGGTAPAV